LLDLNLSFAAKQEEYTRYGGRLDYNLRIKARIVNWEVSKHKWTLVLPLSQQRISLLE
jgi:hypothetical protein